MRWFGLLKIWEIAVSGFMGFSICRDEVWIYVAWGGGGMNLVLLRGLGARGLIEAWGSRIWSFKVGACEFGCV